MAAASRAIRIASVKLGPIAVEAGILGAVEDEDAGLVSVCTHDGADKAPAKIKRRDFCPLCDNDDRATFQKARVVGSGVVLIDADALAAMAVEEVRKKTIELTVHPVGQLAGAFPSGKSYYLSPRAGAANNYVLLATLLARRPDLAFVGEFSFGGPSALYQMLVTEGVLTLRQLARPEAIRDRPLIDGVANEAYLPLAEQFAEAICTDFTPEAYRDRRREVLAKIVEAAVPVALADAGPAAAPASAAGDLGAALLAALAVTPAKKPARRAPAKRAAKIVAPRKSA